MEEKTQIQTPYFLIHENELQRNIQVFRDALSTYWPNSVFSYSVKTNSLPWMLKYLKGLGSIYAETVSDDEYQLARLCGFEGSEIIYNGPIKSEKQLRHACVGGSVINIDSKRELDFFESEHPTVNGALGLRLNIDESIFNQEDVGFHEEGFRFGFCQENGEFGDALERISSIYPNMRIGLHLHVNTATRSVDSYRQIAKYAGKIIQKYHMDPVYIDIGGGYFGGVPGKPSAPDYLKVIREELERVVNPKETALIVEPGSAIIGSVVDIVSTVVDVKDTNKTRIVTTDTSRLHIDPVWQKKNYFYVVKESEAGMSLREIIPHQVICGFTCMDRDRIMVLENQGALSIGDRLVFHRVGNYTVTLGGMFIRTLPEVYLETMDGSVKCVRHKLSMEDYIKIEE